MCTEKNINELIHNKFFIAQNYPYNDKNVLI